MHDKFSSKINDFVNWCETAIEHYNKGYYADSLLNMRKSGEAACKLMFYYRYSEKVALEKTEGKSYKELIQAVISNDLAERMVINWLEALQIHGNDAAHDRQIEKEHADFAVKALRLFINWLFTQCIKSAVPARLKKAMATLEQIPKAENKDQEIQKELDRTRKEKAELEKLLSSFSERKTEGDEKINELASSLEKSITRLKDIETDKEKSKINEVAATIPVPEEVKMEKNPGGNRKKIIYTGIALAAVFLILFFAIKHWNTNVSEISGTISKSQPVSTADSFRVLLLPLSVMQDNPNMVLKFEDAMQSSIKQRIKEKNIPVSISFDREFIKPSVSFDEAAQEGSRYNTNVVLFGELYEPLSSSDSAQVNIKFTLNRQPKRISEEMGIRSFLRLSDSASLKIQTGVVCFVDLAYADFLMTQGKYNQALTVLYDSKPASITQQINVADLLSICHSSQKNYAAAIKEIEKYIPLQTKDKDYGYSQMANALNNLGDFRKAEEYYQKALAIRPNNVGVLLSYAQMISFQAGRLPESKELLLQAVRFDSTNSTAWWYLGDMEKLFNDFKKAERYYRKSLSLDSTNTIVKTNLGEILSFNLDKPEEGERIFSALLSKDTANSSLLFRLANIYTTTRLKNPDKADYYLAKSKKYQTVSNEYSNKYAEGLVAIEKGDYRKAMGLLLAAYTIDSSDMELNNYLASCYINTRDYGRAYYYINRAWKKDTLAYTNNFNLGYFYLTADKKYADLKKSAYHLEKALKINPYDAQSLEFLATVYYNFGNYPETKELLLRLHSVQPNNFNANKGLGELYWMDGDYKKAAQYYETALSLYPNDDVVNSKYALNLMKVSNNNYSTAMKYAKKAVELNPDNADNLFLLAQMYIFAKDYKRGKDYYYKALALKPSIKDPGTEQELEMHK